MNSHSTASDPRPPGQSSTVDAVPPGHLLSIEAVEVSFEAGDTTIHAVRDVSIHVDRGEIVGVVGESGSGKTVTMLALVGLLPGRAHPTIRGSAFFGDVDLLALSEDELEAIRGDRLGFIFQDALEAFNPVLRVGYQIAETMVLHRGLSWKRAKAKTIELLTSVGISEAVDRSRQYPHEFSGGMLQRAMIAMAIANEPELIVADEPTTALDVTIQAQVLDVIQSVREASSCGVILISHDLELVGERADRVVVMYAGTVVESGSVEAVFTNPRHPYTIGLLRSTPSLDDPGDGIEPIPGEPPSAEDVLQGCPYEPRCDLGRGRERCRFERPLLRAANDTAHVSACHFMEELTSQDQDVLGER